MNHNKKFLKSIAIYVCSSKIQLTQKFIDHCKPFLIMQVKLASEYANMQTTDFLWYNTAQGQLTWS